MLKARCWFNWDLSLIPSHSELWASACCCSLFMAGIGRALFHTFRTLLRPLLFTYVFFCLSLPLCQNVFHLCMRWCTTDWGHRRWSGNLLAAPCSPPSRTRAPDLLSCTPWTRKQVKCFCACAHMCSLYFSLLCHVVYLVYLSSNRLGSTLQVLWEALLWQDSMTPPSLTNLIIIITLNVFFSCINMLQGIIYQCL